MISFANLSNRTLLHQITEKDIKHNEEGIEGIEDMIRLLITLDEKILSKRDIDNNIVEVFIIKYNVYVK